MAPSSSSRRSRAPASSSRPSTTTNLPAAQRPAGPLSDRALQDISNLPLKIDLAALKNHQKASITKLSDTASDLNEFLYERKRVIEERIARRKEKGKDDDGPLEGEVELRALERKVKELTAKMEEGIRRGIDGQAKLEARENALKATVESFQRSRNGGGAAAATQSTLGASQFRQRRRDGSDDEDDEDEDNDDEEESENRDIQQPIEDVLVVFNRKSEELQDEYNNLSMRQRYI